MGDQTDRQEAKSISLDRQRVVLRWKMQSRLASGLQGPRTCGLGVPDLCPFGYALRLRWNWLARTQTNSCWARLPVPKETIVEAMCSASLSVIIGNGCRTVFWTNNWAPVGPLHLFAPALYKATSRAGRKRTVHDAMFDHRWVANICRAITV